jgi:hypothetical protein
MHNLAAAPDGCDKTPCCFSRNLQDCLFFTSIILIIFWQVALGRLALEPLAVLASLCRSDGTEILSLNLHPLQSHVPESELLKAAERCLMTVVAQVLNFLIACNQPHCIRLCNRIMRLLV